MIAVGLRVVAGPGQREVELIATSRGLAERHLSTWHDDRLDVVVMGRLHYRDDHRRWLADQDLAPCTKSDAALAAALYALPQGNERLLRLEGEFALVVIDAERRLLLALRDPLGTYPLFWTQRGSRIAVSTSIRPLTDLAGRAEPDPEYLADFLAFPIDSVSELPTTGTAYAGISRVRPGWLLEADLETGTATSTPVPEWEREIAPVPVGTPQEAGALVRDALEAAVAQRTSARARTAAHFSGGFDSTGLALLAATQLDRDGAAPLVALTLGYPNSRVLAGERRYVEAALKAGPRMTHRWVNLESYLELDGHELLPPTDEPCAKVFDYLPSALLIDAAHGARADTILSGQGGDHLFHRSLTLVVASLLASGRRREAVAVARAHASGRRAVPVLLAAAQLALPIDLRNGPGALLTTGREGDEMLDHLAVPPWVAPDFARAARLAERSRVLGGTRLTSHVFSAADLPFVAGDWYHWNIAVPRGLTQARPYFDPRVVRLALGIPVQLQVAPSQQKPVLAAALADLLPATIVERRRKATANEARAGFARHRDWLQQLVASTAIDDAIVDRSALAACVDEAALGIHERFSLWRLRMTLAYMIWLADRRRWASQKVPLLSAVSRSRT